MNFNSKRIPSFPFIEKLDGSLLKAVVDCRSLTVISWIVEETIQLHSSKSLTSDEQKTLDLMKKIQDLNNLDLIYAAVHRHLGNADKAKELEDFVAKRSAQAKV